MQRGRYRVIEPLGYGGAAVVYRATDGRCEVALKVIREPDSVAQARLGREARLAGKIDSRHLVRIFDVGDDYLVMPLYPSSLAATLRSGPLSVRDTVEKAAQLAQALDALHAKGIVHRDVKPANVLLDEHGDAILADFGLARASDSTRLTREGQIIGSLHYLAPELIEGGEATPAADLYALGCLLYECLAGRPPFAGTEAEVAYAHLVEPPPRLDGLSTDLTAALLSALEKEPRARPTTATALARMLHLASTPAPA